MNNDKFSWIEENKLVSIADVMKLLGRQRTSVYTMEKDGRLPKALKLNGRIIGWRAKTLDQWFERLEA